MLDPQPDPTSHWPSVHYHYENAPPIPAPEALDYHSINNILNVISIIIGAHCVDHPSMDEAVHVVDEALKIEAQIAADAKNPVNALKGIDAFCDRVAKIALKLHQGNPEKVEAGELLQDVVSILKLRVSELLKRASHPLQWIDVSSEEISQMLKQTFMAIEKNSQGKYGIVYDVASQQPDDYLIELQFSPFDGDFFTIPPVLLDCIRDLAANARKYSDPGSKIVISLEDNGFLRLAVKDNGLGIPKGELKKVVDHGYRASNVKHHRTLGGGYGLTKALWVAMSHKGIMKITSLEGEGTLVSIWIPAQKNNAA